MHWTVNDFPCLAEQNATQNMSVATQKSSVAPWASFVSWILAHYKCCSSYYYLQLNVSIQCARNMMSWKYFAMLDETVPCWIIWKSETLHDTVHSIIQSEFCMTVLYISEIHCYNIRLQGPISLLCLLLNSALTLTILRLHVKRWIFVLAEL